MEKILLLTPLVLGGDYRLRTPKGFSAKEDFNILKIDGPLITKIIAIYDQVKSRDLYDLMALTKDHGYTLDDIFSAVAAYQPIRNKDPEHFKSVATGLMPLDKDDEGFSSINLNVKLDEIFKYFKRLIDEYEVRMVNQMRAP